MGSKPGLERPAPQRGIGRELEQRVGHLAANVAGNELRRTLDVVHEVGESVAVGGTLVEWHRPVIQFLEFGFGQFARFVPSASFRVEEHVGEGDERVQGIVVAIGVEIRLDVLLAQTVRVAGKTFCQVAEFLNETAANDVVVPVQSQRQRFPVEDFLPGGFHDQVRHFARGHVVEK